ncbi:MAG: NADH:ubiquinone oxidoreductase subunit J, partial [Pseudonocardiaceae bacterium]
WPARIGSPPADPTFALGEALMGTQMLTMMTLGLAIFATIVTTVLLATSRGRYDRFGDDLDAARADDPVPGGLGR